jgi:hypothetical protein
LPWQRFSKNTFSFLIHFKFIARQSSTGRFYQGLKDTARTGGLQGYGYPAAKPFIVFIFFILTFITAVRVKTADRAGNVIKTVPAFSRMVTGRNGR